ncbi:MAG: Ig-like domain-containing protein, partial [Thermoleophilia bacterium]
PDGPNVGSGVEVARAPGGGALLAWRAPPGIASMPVDAAGAAGTVRTPVADGVLGAPVMAGSGSAFRMIWPSTMPASEAVIGLDATGQASTAQQAIDGAASVSSTALSVGPAGRALALWGRNGGSVAARFVAPDGTPEAATISAPAAGQAQFATDADLLADGTGVLLWTQGPSGQARGLMSRVVRPDGSLEDTATLAPVADQAEFAAAPSGVGLVVWQDRATAGGPPRARARQFLPAPACPDATATSVQGRETTVVLACQGLQLQTPEVLTTPAGGTLGLVDGPAGRVTYTPRPGFEGVDSFTFRGRNPGGSGAAATARITVGRDTVVPRVTAMRLSVSRVRLRTSFRRPPARRPALVLRLSEPATITVNLQRKRRGVFRSFRTLRSPGPVTRATFRLPKKGLVPGAYRANVVVTDLAGNRSAPRRAGFVVVRG